MKYLMRYIDKILAVFIISSTFPSVHTLILTFIRNFMFQNVDIDFQFKKSQSLICSLTDLKNIY